MGSHGGRRAPVCISVGVAFSDVKVDLLGPHWGGDVWLQWPNVDEGWPNVDEGWAFGQMFCSAAGGQKPVPLL